MSKVQYSYPDTKTFKNTPYFIIYGTNNQHTRYRLEGSGGKRRIISAEHSDAPWESYQYDEKKPYLLTKRSLPEGRYTEVEYYYSDKEPFPERVKLQKAPVGIDNSPIITHRFVYSESPYGGSAFVLDAHQHQTGYIWNPERRLCSIEHYQGNSSYALYSQEKLYWGTQSEATQLLAHTFGKESPLFCRSFVYDERGNVLVEKLSGNLSGHNQIPIIQGSDGRALDNGCESSIKTFCYSADNQLLVETDSRKSSSYRYLPDTDLVTAQYTWVNGAICQRTFCFYDDNAALVRQVCDDGNKEQRTTSPG